MKPGIAVFGAGDNGHVMAADLALAGYQVNLLELPKYKEKIAGTEKLGGIHLSGEKHNLISGKSGFAKLNKVTTDAEEAIKNVDVIVIDDITGADYEERVKAIAPYLKNEAVINFNAYGYWPSLRVAEILKDTGKESVTLTESLAPVHWAEGKDGRAVSTVMRERVPVAVFPSKRNKETFDILKPIFPSFELAKNVLQTNLENLNMLVHCGIALLNIGAFERAAEKGEKFNFYVMGNTVHGTMLEEAQDRERISVCQAYKVPYTSLRDYIIRFYKSKGSSVQEAICNTKRYQDPGWWIGLNYVRDYVALGDVTSAIVPFVRLAELAGVVAPVTRSIVEVFGAAFGIDLWKKGLTLEKLGLAGLTPREVIEYVTEGTK